MGRLCKDQNHHQYFFYPLFLSLVSHNVGFLLIHCCNWRHGTLSCTVSMFIQYLNTHLSYGTMKIFWVGLHYLLLGIDTFVIVKLTGFFLCIGKHRTDCFPFLRSALINSPLTTNGGELLPSPSAIPLWWSQIIELEFRYVFQTLAEHTSHFYSYTRRLFIPYQQLRTKGWECLVGWKVDFWRSIS